GFLGYVVFIRPGDQSPAVDFGCTIPRHIDTLLAVVMLFDNGIWGSIRVTFPLALIRAITAASAIIFCFMTSITVTDVVEQFAILSELRIVRLGAPLRDPVAVF